MRNWKIALGAAVAVAALVATVVVLRQERPSARRHGRGGDAQPAMLAMPVPVAKIVKKDDPDLSRLFGAHGIDPQHRAAGQGLRLYPAAARRRTAPTSRKAICSTRSIRATIRPRSTRPRRRRSATWRRSTMRARISIAASALAKSGFLAKDTFDQRTSAVAAGRSGAGDGSQAAVTTAELNLGYTRNPRAVRRPARPQPGAGRHADQRRRRAAEHAGAARSDLRHVQSERDGPRRDPEGARGRARSRPTFSCPARRRRATTAS